MAATWVLDLLVLVTVAALAGATPWRADQPREIWMDQPCLESGEPVVIVYARERVPENEFANQIVFVTSAVGAPGVLLLYATNASATQLLVLCERLRNMDIGSVVVTGYEFTGVSLVFESIYEVAPRDLARPTAVTFDGTDAAEFDPVVDAGRTLQQFNISMWSWTVEDVAASETDLRFTFASTNGPVRIQFSVDPAGTLGTTGAVTSDMLLVRLAVQQASFLAPETSGLALATSVSAGRGYSCPAFEYSTLAVDSALPKLCRQLVVPVRDPFGEEDGGIDGDGRLGGPAARPMMAADTMVDEVYEAHVASPWLMWLSPIAVNVAHLPADAIQPYNALPAVVNTTRLAGEAAIVPYASAPFSVLKAAVFNRSISCIKRAYVTVEGGAVGSYVAWDAHVGFGPFLPPSPPDATLLTIILVAALPAAVAVLIGVASLARICSVERRGRSDTTAYVSIGAGR